MASKGSKERGKGKRSHPRGIGNIYALLAASLVILALGLHLSLWDVKIPPPAYEESSLRVSDLDRAIGRIDVAIYDALYQGAVPVEAITFPEVKAQRGQGKEWDFTEILVSVPGRQWAVQLLGALGGSLGQLGPWVDYGSREVAGDEILCEISARGLHTHRLRIIYGLRAKPPHLGLPKVALIIDDLGYDHEMAASFLRLALPVTFSILPVAPYTDAIAREASRRGREIMLHLPMEPNNYPSLDPGPGAILREMDEGQIRSLLAAHLRRVPGTRGVNHHMGSYLTERRDKMGVILRELKVRNLYYVDSRTTTRTVALKLARQMGVRAARRHVFIDNDVTQKALIFQMERLLGMARHRGGAIGIAHPHPETLRVIEGFMHRLREKFRVVPVSRLVH